MIKSVPSKQTLKPIEGFFFRDFKNAYFPDILDEIYVKKVYEPFLTNKDALTIVDWGANVGLTSYYFKDYAKQVYAVEPSIIHLETLRKMLEFNKITNVKVCPYAISNKNGKTKFFHSENTTSFTLVPLVPDGTDFEEVETVDVKEFFTREKIDQIDLLKMDLEGEESKVVASDVFKEYAPKIKIIIGEWHDWTDMNRVQFQHTLEDLGYEFNWYYTTKAAVFSAVR